MKISSKYEKEVDKLIKLIYDYWIKEKITKKDLDSSFSFTDEKKVEIIKEGFMQAIHEKNSDKIEYLTTSISTFKLFPKYSLDFVDIFSKLSKEEFHEEHETIASYFQRLHLPQTIDCIYELAISNFEKYRWDDNFALFRKCCFALGDINTPKAKEKLENSEVRCQWDPDRDIYGNPIGRRAIQLGIKGETVRKYVNEWIVNITDITDKVIEIRNSIQNGTFSEVMLPEEKNILFSYIFSNNRCCKRQRLFFCFEINSYLLTTSS